MLVCPDCHSKNPDEAKFCIECGADLKALSFKENAIDNNSESIESKDLHDVDPLVHTEDMQGFNDVSVAPEARKIFGSKSDDASKNVESRKSSINDFTGLELIVDSSYIPPDNDTNVTNTQGSSKQINDVATSDNEYKETEQNPPVVKKRRHIVYRVCVLAIIILIVAGVIAAVATYNMQLWGGKVIPDVSGLSRMDAQKQLEDVGFEVSIEQVKSDNTEGIALSTEPDAGKRTDMGTEVVLYVSIARYIPAIIGLDQEKAVALLENEGFNSIEFDYKKSNETEGCVIGVTPAEGQHVTQDEKIVVTLAQSYVVPDVLGLDVDTACAALEEEGYETQIIRQDTEDVSEGEVISIYPEAGSKYPNGEAVTLYVAHNRSKELIELATNFLNDETTVMTIHDAQTNQDTEYEINEVTSVVYEGNGICSFTLQARPYETHSWIFGLGTEKRYGDPETINGEIHFDTNNEITSVYPEMTQGS